ncbi:hypothetical protein ONZ45_g13488 [Pleurotus djamor]|nr:hypothetical protein ONZ45_g13488 [Pleurotus djamor]
MTKNSLSDVAPLDRSNPQGVCSTSASGPSVTTKDLGPTALKIGDNASALGGAKTECSNCGATQTPLWRKGLNDELNCNACGLYYKLHKHPRPKNMWSRSNHRHAQAAPGGRGRSISPSRPSKHTQVRVGPEAECYNCHTTATPLWRKDGEGETVCNACGLFYKLHGVARPLSMRSNVVRKRSSHATQGLSNDSSELPSDMPKIIHRALGFTKQLFTTDVNLPALHTERHPTIINLSGLEIPATKPIDDQADEQEKISKSSIHDVHVFNDSEHGVLELPSILATPFDTDTAAPINEELGEDRALHDPSDPQIARETALRRALLGARDLTLQGVTSTFYESKPKHSSSKFRRRKTMIIINAQENCGNIVRMINSHNDSSRYEVNSGDVSNNNYGDGTFTNAHVLNDNTPPNNVSEDYDAPVVAPEQPTIDPTTGEPYLMQWIVHVWSWVPCFSWTGWLSGWMAQLVPQVYSQWVWPQ